MRRQERGSTNRRRRLHRQRRPADARRWRPGRRWAAAWVGCWGLLGVLATGAMARDDYEIKVYPAPRAAGPVVVDGRLAEASWRVAPVVSGFTLYNGPALGNPQTHVRLTYDEEHLYVGVVCDEPRMDLVEPAPVPRDAREVFRGDAVEIFLDPRHDHGLYYQFGISVAGSLYDSQVKDRVWNAAVRAAVALADSSWSVEVAIPWADLGVAPADGALLGFNVCRDRRGDRPQWTNWAQTKAGFHDPVRFAHLVLSPPPGALDGMETALRLGDRRGSISIYTAAGTSQVRYEELAEQALSTLRRTLDQLETVAREEPSPVARRALADIVAAARRRLQPFAAQVAAPGPLDASAWSRMQLAVDELTLRLGDALWAARLRALLARI